MKTVLSLIVILAALDVNAQSSSVVGNFHIGNTSLSLNSALAKVIAKTPVVQPDGGIRLERTFGSSDGAIKIVCAEDMSHLPRTDTSCDISIDSALSQAGVTTVSVGTYAPVVVVEFLDSNDQSKIEKMVTVGTLHASEKVSLTAADGKILSAPAWELTPGARTSTKKTTFVLAAPFDEAAVEFQVTNNFELYKSANGSSVLQDGVVKFRFAPEVDANRPFCYVTNANFLPTQGLARVKSSESTDAGHTVFKLNLIPDDALRTIFCQSDAKFTVEDVALTLKGIIDVK